MLEEPPIGRDVLREALRDAYGIHASSYDFVPGYDPRSASYAVTDSGGERLFVKVRFDAITPSSLEVPAALLETGVPNVLAPRRTLTSGLSVRMPDGASLVAYPHVAGSNAMEDGLTMAQWRAFGSTLRGVHDSGLEHRFGRSLRTDSFSSTVGESVSAMLELAHSGTFDLASARRHAAFLRDQESRIGSMLGRTAELGAGLRGRHFERVLCHADIHAANILVADEGGGILLVDWDGPMIAPRERDLLFVIGSRVARTVEPREEAWFFEGYGDATVDAGAIVYYRYERILEDIAEFTASILLDRSLTEATRESEADLVAANFGPGGMVESVEDVSLGWD